VRSIVSRIKARTSSLSNPWTTTLPPTSLLLWANASRRRLTTDLRRSSSATSAGLISPLAAARATMSSST
jgi:hypothetical protein